MNFEFGKIEESRVSISANLIKINAKTQSTHFFELIYSEFKKHQTEEQEETETKMVKKSKNVNIENFEIKKQQQVTYLTQKEIIYGLSSNSVDRKNYVFKYAKFTILNPAVCLAVDFEEILIVFLSLKLDDLSLSDNIEENYQKIMCALFIYNPLFLLK